MELTGLNTDQAPPISVPISFFLTAPLFAFLAGFLILISDANILSNRFTPESIAIVHAVTIGFMGFVILGAITQMLPVLAGVKIYRVKFITRFSYLFLVFGLLFMVFGLYFAKDTLNAFAVVALSIGFLSLLIPMLISLSKVKNFSPTVKAMMVSLLFALMVIIMGAKLLSSYVTGVFSDYHLAIANVHSVWAIFGFIGILIIGVAFQVLPMFYVAPKFRPFCKQRVVILISIGLVLWFILNIFEPEYSYIAKIWIGTFFWAFATAVWVKLNKRRRPITDVTIWYWRTSSIFMTIGIFAWVFNSFLDDKYIVVISVMIGFGFIFSIMTGMIYKIVPFLVWFHLNAKGYMSIPTINEMINKKSAKIQYVLFILSLIGFVISYFEPLFLEYSAFIFMLSMIILEFNIINPIIIYIKTIKTKPDFDMSAFKIGD